MQGKLGMTSRLKVDTEVGGGGDIEAADDNGEVVDEVEFWVVEVVAPPPTVCSSSKIPSNIESKVTEATSGIIFV